MEISHNTAENSANIRQYYFWIFFVLYQNFLFLNSLTLYWDRFYIISMRRTQIGCRLSRTTNWKNKNLSNIRHTKFDHPMTKKSRSIGWRKENRNAEIKRPFAPDRVRSRRLFANRYEEAFYNHCWQFCRGLWNHNFQCRQNRLSGRNVPWRFKKDYPTENGWNLWLIDISVIFPHPIIATARLS